MADPLPTPWTLSLFISLQLEQKQKEALELLEQNRHLQDQLKVALGREQSAREGYVLQVGEQGGEGDPSSLCLRDPWWASVCGVCGDILAGHHERFDHLANVANSVALAELLLMETSDTGWNRRQHYLLAFPRENKTEPNRWDLSKVHL